MIPSLASRVWEFSYFQSKTCGASRHRCFTLVLPFYKSTTWVEMNRFILDSFWIWMLCSMLIAALGSGSVGLLRCAHSAPAVQRVLEVAVHLVGLSLIHIPQRFSQYFFFLSQGSCYLCPDFVYINGVFCILCIWSDICSLRLKRSEYDVCQRSTSKSTER